MHSEVWPCSANLALTSVADPSFSASCIWGLQDPPFLILSLLITFLMSFNLVTNLRGYFTPKTSPATMEKYTSVPTSDSSSAEALLNKGARNSLDTDSVEDFSSHHKPRSWYRRNERTLITGIVVFLANMTICVVYTHWLTSQYSHLRPTPPWCMSPVLSKISNRLTAYSPS